MHKEWPRILIISQQNNMLSEFLADYAKGV